MHSAWTSKREFGTLAGELAEAQDRDFERAVLPFIRAVWPEAQISPARQRLDRAGIDIYVGKPPQFEVAIQCKGFLERELLDDQIRQCRASIRAFAKSRYSTKAFYLLHNRHKETSAYTAALDSELIALVPSKAGDATLWNHRNLLVAAFDAMQVRVRRALTRKTSAMRAEQELAERVLGGEPLRAVPVATFEMRINAARLRSSTTPVISLADPLALTLQGERRRIGVLIAPAGFGKTTTVMRAVREHSDVCVFLPAARIRGDMANAHSVFEAALDPEDVVGDAQDEDRSTWLRIVGPIVKYLTQSERRDMLVIIDALDESPALDRSYDLHRFFNILGRAKVPIVITMRKEFWSSRRSDFDATLGEAAERESTTQTLRVVELLPWDDLQIIAAAEAYRVQLVDGEGQHRVGEFTAAVRSGRFAELFGDIPRTPLFLKFILDVLRDDEVERMNRVELLTHWVRLKIVRDVTAPARFGGTRVAIRSSVTSVDDTVALSFAAMGAAAVAMCRRDGNHIDLQPWCTFDEIRRAMTANTPDSPASLMLNSLLIPTEDRRVDGTQRMRFAHRVFQEFFLARAVADDERLFADAVYPDAVAEWVALLSSRQ